MKERDFSKKKHHHNSGKEHCPKSEFKNIRIVVFSNETDYSARIKVEADPKLFPSVSEALQDRVIHLVDRFLLQTDFEYADEFIVHWEVEEDSGRVRFSSINCHFSALAKLAFAYGAFKNPAVEYAELFTKCYESQVLPVIKDYKLR